MVAERHRAARHQESYRYEQGFTLELYTSPDSQEARDAFVEKRDADFAEDTKTEAPVDLRYTPEHDAFRQEARLARGPRARPGRSPPSTRRRASRQHREWEKKLHAGGFAMVPWPVEYGGRGADLLEWLIFEEEYYRAGAPGRVNQNGIFLLGPTIMEVRHAGAEGALPAEDGLERGGVGPGLVRAQRRQRHGGNIQATAIRTTATTT